MKEAQIEVYGRKLAEHLKLLHMKFTSPQRNAVPDRIVLAQVPPLLVPIIARYVRFVEYKSSTGTVTAAQHREHERLKKMGFTVDVVNSREQAKEVLQSMGEG